MSIVNFSRVQSPTNWNTTQPGKADSRSVGSLDQRPAAQDSSFARAEANPFNAKANGNGGGDSSNTALADKVYHDVVDQQEARKTFQSYDFKGRAAAAKEKLDPITYKIAEECANQTIKPEDVDRILKERTGPIEAELDRSFGRVPPNPDAYQKPAGAYDWNARGAMEAKLMDPITKEIAEAVQRGEIKPKDVSRILKERMAPIEAQINAECGKAPEIMTSESVSRTPGYPYEARAEKTDEVLTPIVDKLIEEVTQGIINRTINPKDIDKMLKERTAGIEEAMDREFGRMPDPKPYDPAMDTQKNYEVNRWQMESKLQSMQSSGAPPEKVLSYKLQRQSELAQIFPKQAVQIEAQEQWKGVALHMQAAGKPAGEIKEYLDKKAAEVKELSSEELEVYTARKKTEAAEIAALAKASEGNASGSSGARGAQF